MKDRYFEEFNEIEFNTPFTNIDHLLAFFFGIKIFSNLHFS